MLPMLPIFRPTIKGRIRRRRSGFGATRPPPLRYRASSYAAAATADKMADSKGSLFVNKRSVEKLNDLSIGGCLVFRLLEAVTFAGKFHIG